MSSKENESEKHKGDLSFNNFYLKESIILAIKKLKDTIKKADILGLI